MSEKRLGVDFSGSVRALNDSDEILAGIEKAEVMGIPAAWLITVGAHLDAITLFAAAAVRTERIMLGTSITPTYPRHPVSIAQQVQVLGQLAPGRFRLGIGPSRRRGVEDMLGLEYKAPLGHLREYVRILKALLHRGEVDFDGRYYHAHASIRSPMDIPVMASGLGPKAFELCGAEADGGISWLVPGNYLRDVAVAAMKAGAEKAGRPVPPLVMHAPVCVHDNADEVRSAVGWFFGSYLFPEFVQLFTASGLPESAEGAWSDGMVDAIALWGDESRVAERIKELYSFGVDEIIATPVPAGDNRDASIGRTMRLIADLAPEVAKY